MPGTLPQHGDLVAAKYRLKATIGEGGYGVVFRAQHETMGRDVAIKMLRPEASENLDEIERFRREVFHASSLRHHNTITLYDYGQTPDGLLYIVMEYLRGLNLRQWLKRHGPMPHDVTLSTLEQILRSLREAHEQNIIHRDLKPENIFIQELSADEHVVKVLDFGLSKAIGQSRRKERTVTKEGQAYGTPQYMSPEQACAMKLTATSDIYALGLLVYEMLTGQTAFDGPIPVDILLKQVNDPTPELPAPLRKSILEEFILRATQKDPADRYQDAREALSWLIQRQSQAASPSPQEQRSSSLMPSAGASKLHQAIIPSNTPQDANPMHSVLVESRFGREGLEQLDSKELELRVAQLPMMGRRDELEELLRWGKQAMLTGGVLRVSGDHGLGKSRLIDEWLRHMEMHAVLILHGRCRPEDTAMEGLRQALAPALNPGALHGQLELAVEQRQSLQKVLQPTQPHTPTGQSGQHWAFAGIEHPVYTLAARRPTIFVIEDLHWADSFTHRLIEHWQEDMATRTLPLLLVFSQRQELERHDTPQDAISRLSLMAETFSHAHHIHLKPLETRHAQQLLDDLLPLEPALKQRIIDTARGNPQYLTQIVRYLVDEQRLEPQKQGKLWRLKKDQDAQLLPPDLESLLIERILAQLQQHRLGAVLEAILLRAILLGQRFEIRLLKEFLRIEGRGDLEAYLDDAIEAFTRSGVLVTTVIDARPGLEFGYEMLRSSLIERRGWADGWDTEAREPLHVLAAQAKLQHCRHRREDVEPIAHEIAHHYKQAKDLERAFEWIMRAAQHAERLQDFRQALTHLRDANQLLSPELDPDGEHLLEIRMSEGRLYRHLGEFGPAEGALKEALDETRRVGDIVGEAMTGEQLAGVLTLVTRYDEADKIYKHIDSLYAQFQDANGQLRCELGQAEIARFRGRYPRALKLFTQALEQAERLQDMHAQVRCLFGLGQCAFTQGKLTEARERFKAARKRAETLGDALLRSEADIELATIALYTDHVEEAISLVHQALELKQNIGDSLGSAHAHLIMGLALRHTTRQDKARFHAQRARTINERLGHVYGIAKSVLLESEILWTMGLTVQAAQRTEDAAQLHEQIGDAHGMVMVLIHQALCETELGRSKEAMARLKRAQVLIETHQMWLYECQLLLVHGLIRELDGELEDAVGYFDEAFQKAKQVERADIEAMAAINLAKLHLIFGDLSAARHEGPLALERAERLGHVSDMLFALILSAVLARIARDADALSSSIRRLRVLDDSTSGVNLRAPERLVELARVVKETRYSERSFPIVLTIIEILRSLGHDDQANRLAREIMPS